MPGKHKVFFRFPDVLIIPFVVLAFVVSYGIVHLAMHTRNNVSYIDLSDISEGTSDTAYSIEEQNDTPGYIEIKGWFVIPGRTYDYYNFGQGKGGSGVYNEMHLALLDGDRVVMLPTILIERPDVTEALGDGLEYDYCGFITHIPNDFRQLAGESGFCMVVSDPYDNLEIYRLE